MDLHSLFKNIEHIIDKIKCFLASHLPVIWGYTFEKNELEINLLKFLSVWVIMFSSKLCHTGNQMSGVMCAVLMHRSSTSAVLKHNFLDGTIGFPNADPLPGDNRDMSYFIVAYDAFALRTWLMKPFSGRNLNDQEPIFNYRLSRARHVVENAFSILANRFKCLLTTMAQEPHNVTSVVLVV